MSATRHDESTKGNTYRILDKHLNTKSLPNSVHVFRLQSGTTRTLPLAPGHSVFICFGLLHKPAHEIVQPGGAHPDVEMSFAEPILPVFNHNFGGLRRRDAQQAEGRILEKTGQ